MTTFDSTLGASVIQSPINFSASGDNLLILGTPGLMIKIIQFFFVLSAATNLTYKSGITAISGPMDFPGPGAQVLDFIQLPLTCNQGDSFLVNSTNAVQFGGTIWYIKS